MYESLKTGLETTRKKIIPILLVLLVIFLALYAFYRTQVFGIIFWALFIAYIVYFFFAVVITVGKP